MTKAKPKVDPLIGRRVRVNPDASDLRGDPHPQAGLEALVTDRNPGRYGQYHATIEGHGAVLLALDTFTILPLAEGEGGPPGIAVPQPSTAAQGAGELMVLETRCVIRSRTNPRTRFDEAFIADLAVSIKMFGLAQPILVRPLPASRLHDTFEAREPGAPLPTHEIIAGEQRLRACMLAGIKHIPVLCRAVDDSTMLQLQLVENLNRKDLHPMEEAEGYEKLMRETGLSAEDVADIVRKGRTSMYKTLSLLRLTAEVRTAFYDGKLNRSTAELVARMPEALQGEVLKAITHPDFHGDPLSYRAAKALVEDRYMLQLGSAPFKITDPDLLPQAGTCRACPKRTGASPDLFDDVKNGDTCTDPTCFAAKKDAHYNRLKAQATERGQVLITGKQAKEIMPHGTLRGYTDVDAHLHFSSSAGKTLRKALGDTLPATMLLEDPQTHVLIEVLPTATVGQLLKDKGVQANVPDTTPPAESEAEKKRKATEQYERTWRKRAIEQMFTAMRDGATGAYGLGLAVIQAATLELVDGMGKAERDHVCDLLGLGKICAEDAIRAAVRETVDSDVASDLLMLLLMQRDMRIAAVGDVAPATRIEAVSQDTGLDLLPIQAEVQKEMKAAAKARAQAASPTPAPSTKPTRKPKTTKAEASAAIAQALQQESTP